MKNQEEPIIENATPHNEIYLKIYQLDGRIENFHFSMIKIDPVLDVMNHIVATGAWFESISKEQFIDDIRFAKNIQSMEAIDIHEDKDEPNDAQGDKIGFMEHYELKSQS